MSDVVKEVEKKTRKKREKKEEKVISIEAALWNSANKLRGSVEASEYKHVVLPLLFLKYANEKYEIQKAKLISDGMGAFINEDYAYLKDNVFLVPEEARWSYLMANAKTSDITLKIDRAFSLIDAQHNDGLKDALPVGYFLTLQIDSVRLGSILDELNKINLDMDSDVFGRCYEYCLAKFAVTEGKGKGEFYTPKTVVQLLCELIEPYNGIIYDGACGSGGMFVQAMDYVKKHEGTVKDLSIYGQEYTASTRRLAMLNLAVRGLPGNFGNKPASTFQEDQHFDLKADYILMNPPFNQKDWRTEQELVNDKRWEGYKVPPVSNANYAWILNAVSKLSDDGVAAIILSNGALSAGNVGNDEYEIRKQLIENDLVEAILILPSDMFYSTNISVSVWIINKNKNSKLMKSDVDYIVRDRRNEVLFMDLRKMGHIYEKKYIEFTEEDRNYITSYFKAWRTQGEKRNRKGIKYENVKEFCYSATIEEIRKSDYLLTPSKYIEVGRDIVNIDFDAEFKKIKTELIVLYQEEEKSKKSILKVLKELGYGDE